MLKIIVPQLISSLCSSPSKVKDELAEDIKPKKEALDVKPIKKRPLDEEDEDDEPLSAK